jgi:chaperonin GroEL
MSTHRKAKTAPKIFKTDKKELRDLVIGTMKRVSDAVGSSMGPGGRVTLLESDFPGIPDKVTKDGVTIFKALGASNPFEHTIIETARNVAERVVTEAGDGTTTSTVLAYNIISNLFDFCEKNPKFSPQRATRIIQKALKETLLPYIEERAIKITEDNKDILRMVAKISANGDDEIADSVIESFELIGFGANSHVTIRESSGDIGYKVERVDGLPLPIGLEESAGKLSVAFINDQGNQRCFLEKPLFLLFDGAINDVTQILPLINALGEKYVNEGSSDYKNMVIMAHGFSESVLTTLAYNMQDSLTINVVPIMTRMEPFLNSQTHSLYDIAAFTGAKVFGLKNQLSKATLQDLGGNMDSFEAYRFRSTIVGEPDPVLVEARVEEIRQMQKTAESKAESFWFEERAAKVSNGIAKLTIFAGSQGEIKERKDRAEDAVCAVRAAITHGALPGGCRVAIDMALLLAEKYEEGNPAREVLMPSLLSLPQKLLENAGYTQDEIGEIISELVNNRHLVYDVENAEYGKAEELGLFDATKAVSESLKSSVSIASSLGTLGAIVVHPRDEVFERSEAKADAEFGRAINNADQFVNEANERA